MHNYLGRRKRASSSHAMMSLEMIIVLFTTSSNFVLLCLHYCMYVCPYHKGFLMQCCNTSATTPILTRKGGPLSKRLRPQSHNYSVFSYAASSLTGSQSALQILAGYGWLGCLLILVAKLRPTFANVIRTAFTKLSRP
jgi:hypothetical protein